MEKFIKTRILSPKDPANHYGSAVCIDNLQIGETIYIGSVAWVEPMIVENITFDPAYGKYEVHTEQCIFTVPLNARINRKTL